DLPAFNPAPYFERNQGQAGPDALFVTNRPEYSARLERQGVTLVLRHTSSSSDVPYESVVRLPFVGASPQTRLEALEEHPGKSNDFFGSDPTKWQTRIPHFARVAYRQIYPGIDLVFYFRAGQLEYDVELQPGADAAAVKVRIEGAKTALNANGDVVISGS